MNKLSFLEIVAEDLLAKSNGDLSRYTIVFTNKRASLFFNKSLARISDKPLWSPKYTTISELFRSLSHLQLADRIKLVCELHKSYTEITQSDESLDHFYSWGELMLSDFDDIDKHLQESSKIFTLLKDLHELDSTDYLTDNQKEALKHFFRNFTDEHTTELKQRFLNLWCKFNDIYTNYQQRLLSQGIAYEGLLYRKVIGDINEGNANLAEAVKGTEKYVFIGFNLLNKVEETIFDLLKKEGKAMFYWDFDDYYMHGNEAGQHIAQHLKYYPNELSLDHPTYHQFGKLSEEEIKAKDVTYQFISSQTNDLQARYIANWLTPERIAAGRKTAIVLADESLLETVLHCIPPTVKDINITTGYPLAHSVVTSFVRIYLTLLQKSTYTLHNVNALLRHPYSVILSDKVEELRDTLNANTIYYPTKEDLCVDETLTQLFTPLSNTHDSIEINSRLLWVIKKIAVNLNEKKDNTSNDYQIQAESLYRMYTLLNRLQTLMKDDGLQVYSLPLYLKLLKQIIQSTSIPFHGEPIEGIQIMGVLETRNLDFEHILLLSCNEGNIPAKVSDSSFIPHSVRKAYGLTTVENKVSIYAYYFYRLIQRSHDVTLLYNNATSDGKTGEMSHFMLQLLAESKLPIVRKTLVMEQQMHRDEQTDVAKTTDMVHKILSQKHISPSALGKYLRCPMAFYYSYIKGIRVELDGDEEEMDNRAFGNIFHKAAELLYKPHENRTLPKSFFDSLLKEKGHETIQRVVDQAFREEYFLLTDSKRPTPKLGGLQVINREMIIHFMLNLVEYDKQQAPLTILATEQRNYMDIAVSTFEGNKTVSVGGIIDRLDEYKDKNGNIRKRVLDYKTGSYPSNKLSMDSVASIFDPAKIDNHSDYFLQTFLYSDIVRATTPTLLYVQQMHKADYTPMLKIGKDYVEDVTPLLTEFRNGIKNLIEEILNPDIPFTKTEKEARCANCDFKLLCKS